MIALLIALCSSASAAELAGVNLPDSADVGGKTLVLNGMGLREKFMVDVYVGGLYLPSKTTNAGQAISMDVPKRIVMHFVYSKVTKEQLHETFMEGLAKLEGGGAHAADMKRLAAMLTDVTAGDEVALEYVPGKGTTLSVNGTAKGTVAGADFMRAVWSIYLGASPPTSKLKKGLLGA